MNSEAKADPTIVITVKLKGALRACESAGESCLGEGRWAVPKKATIKDVIELLSLPIELAGIIFVNGRRVQKDTVLHEGEVVEFFPPIGGG